MVRCAWGLHTDQVGRPQSVAKLDKALLHKPASLEAFQADLLQARPSSMRAALRGPDAMHAELIATATSLQ